MKLKCIKCGLVINHIDDAFVCPNCKIKAWRKQT